MRIIFIYFFAVAANPFLTTSWAQSKPSHPYYGKEFNQIKSQIKNEELKNKLKVILKSGHVINSAQTDDQLVTSCDSIKNCTMQTSLGYNGARTYLFGDFYLVKSRFEFGVQEMYCDRIYTAADFKNGQGSPRPGQVPEETVINTEHTWPQSKFSGKYPKGIQKADLHHLFPTDSQMNSLRGNTIFGEVIRPSEKVKCKASKYGQGEGTNRDVFEPPQQHKGRVARALMYFSIRYDLQITAVEEVILKRWHRDVPVDEQEAFRNTMIQKKQGNRNPFIDYPELADQIQDF